MDLALGLIETRGLVGAIEAADAMVKAADVKIISKEKVTGALIIIKVMGETAAVKSSVEAGAAAAQRVGELVGAHVIPRPDDQIDILVFDQKKPQQEVKTEVPKKKVSSPKEISQTKKNEITSPVEIEKVKTQEVKKEANLTPKKENKSDKDVTEKITKQGSGKKVPSMDQLVILNVHALRRIARGFEDFPIKGRDISKANRAKLLDYFKKLQ